MIGLIDLLYTLGVAACLTVAAGHLVRMAGALGLGDDREEP
jgi:hypothetical protein